MASLFYASQAQGVQRIAVGCGQSVAPRLCSIHAHHRRVNTLRAVLGLPRLSYGWRAERYPARRDVILTYWAQTHRRTLLRRMSVTVEASSAVIIGRVFGAASTQAIAVARCESGLDPLAHNPSGAAGLFQLMPVHWEDQGYDPYDAGTNTRIAYHIYEASGWSAWSSSSGCWG